MHMDMSGGAAVAGAIMAAARLGIRQNIVCLIPAAENMVSGESFRPGDVLTSLSGKTIDVLNTDAEGRLVLADGLTYAKRYEPRLVIDVATLTGAALVALGSHASAIMGKDRSLIAKIEELGELSGDYVWPLPLWDEYKQYTKGVFGDVANIPTSNARYGGAINGGMFLSHFADTFPWVHIDMASRMIAAQGDHLAKGATGEPMRLLLAIAETL
jgi:leucyl aminopeptidase